MVSLSQYRFIRTGLALVYGIAGFGVAVRVATSDPLAVRVMGVTLLLSCLDFVRMALIDLENWHRVKNWYQTNQEKSHPKLANFLYCLIATIVLEIIGLFSSWLWIGLGMVLMAVSQLVFNSFVQVELRPHGKPPLRQWSISERLAVLIADWLALLLTLIWMFSGQPLWVALSLLGMTLAYLGIKYVPMLLK